jgi:hypothetical protein
MSAARRPLLALCSLLLVAVSCSSPTDAPAPDAPPPPLAPVPARLLVVSGDWQEGTVGTELPFPLVAKVVDSVGVPVPNVVVAWEVTSAGGSISPASGSSDSLGTIHTHWTLGAVAATHAVEARVEGIPALSFSATAKAGIVLTVQQSVASTRDEDSVSLTVRVVSRYEIATVVASAENRQANLVPADGAWTGLLVLARGTTTIRVTATDVHGNAGTSIVGVLYSPKPSIIVASPEPYLVVRNGSVRASAACADGNPGCTIELYVGDTLQPNARGQSRVDVTIPLADRGDRPIRVQFRTRDSIERPVTMDRWIYVESSPSLREVASADGLVWDVDADRLLFLEYDGDPTHYPLSGQFSVNALKLRDHSSAAEVTVMNERGKRPHYGYLTPRGAIFVAFHSVVHPGSLHEWRDGSLAELDHLRPIDAYGSLVVRGPWAIWTSERSLFRRDLLLGTNTRVATDVGFERHDVTASGDVVYWSRNQHIFRYRDGTSTQLTGDAEQASTHPVTDGINVVYSKGRSITLIGATGEERILSVHGSNPLIRPLPRRDYWVNNGWVAYTGPGAGDGLQIRTRSPEGTERLVAQVGAYDLIDWLGPGGEVVFTRNARRFISVPDHTAPPVDIGAAWGKVSWRDGKLLLILGRSVFEVGY